jgi:hypothetical protein
MSNGAFPKMAHNGFGLNNRFNVVLSCVMKVRWVFERLLVPKSFIFV